MAKIAKIPKIAKIVKISQNSDFNPPNPNLMRLGVGKGGFAIIKIISDRF